MNGNRRDPDAPLSPIPRGHPRYHQYVREWLRKLRNRDVSEETAHDARQRHLGSLDTGGKLGIAPIFSEDPDGLKDDGER